MLIASIAPPASAPPHPRPCAITIQIVAAMPPPMRIAGHDQRAQISNAENRTPAANQTGVVCVEASATARDRNPVARYRTATRTPSRSCCIASPSRCEGMCVHHSGVPGGRRHVADLQSVSAEHGGSACAPLRLSGRPASYRGGRLSSLSPHAEKGAGWPTKHPLSWTFGTRAYLATGLSAGGARIVCYKSYFAST